jgi:hypothetical protein
MCALMLLQPILPTEQLITLITGKWPVPAMYALMPLQMLLHME